MALNELKQKYKDDPEALKRIETIENQAYGVGQAGNIDEDYADRVASGQSLMSGGGKIWYEDSEGNKLRDTERTTSSTTKGSSSSSRSRSPARRQRAAYEDMYERAQDIVNPRVKSMMEQIESAMLRARKASAKNLAARGQATGGVRESTDRALTAEEMLQKQSAAREGEAQTAELAQDMYTQERGFEMQEDQMAEERRQFNEQMQMAIENRDYDRARDMIDDMRYREEKEFSRDWAKDEREYNRVQNAIQNAFQAKGLNLEEQKLQHDMNMDMKHYGIKLQELALRKQQASNQSAKTSTAEVMTQFEKYYPDIAATRSQSGMKTAVSNVAFMQNKGIIGQDAANAMIDALYAPGDNGTQPEPDELDPYIRSVFVDDGNIKDKNEFLRYLSETAPSPDQALEIAKRWGVSEKEIESWGGGTR